MYTAKEAKQAAIMRRKNILAAKLNGTELGAKLEEAINAGKLSVVVPSSWLDEGIGELLVQNGYRVYRHRKYLNAPEFNKVTKLWGMGIISSESKKYEWVETGKASIYWEHAE